MSDRGRSGRLKKELSLLSVYSLATGATLSAGFFLLPGLAVEEAGPAIVLAYFIAAVPMFPAMLSIVELATAMPRAGGAYYFLDRSLGPLMGTIGGMGTWAALVLKAAFALVGMGAYMALLLPESFPGHSMKLIAAFFAIVFGVINYFGAKSSGRAQIVLVIGLLALLAGFMGTGAPHVRLEHFHNFFEPGIDSIIATAGLIYISYVGVTKIASVSEEVRNPERNLPLGVFLSFATAVVIYGVGTFIMVGILEPARLAGSLTPVAAVASEFAGRWGVWLVSIAALLAFSSVANAGILAASRYPLAMARDHLLPRRFRGLNRQGMPGFSIIITLIVILVLLFVEPIKIAKLASAFQLLMFAMLCLAVVVMRESRIEAYDPGYRVPWYPWLQIVGIVVPFWFIGEMGWLAISFTTLLIAVGAVWYVYYARSRVARYGAVYHVFERLGRRRSTELDRELRGILKEKGLRPADPYEEVVVHAVFLDANAGDQFADVVRAASARLAERVASDADALFDGFMEGTRVGATPVSGEVALPHLRLAGIARAELAIVRARPPITIDLRSVAGPERHSEPISAIFFLVSPEDDPGQHLRFLARLAERVDTEGFQTQWAAASDEEAIKELLLRDEFTISFTIERTGPTSNLVDREVRDVDIPPGCLIVLLHRDAVGIIPEGSTVLREHDRVTVIGNPGGVRKLRRRFDLH